MTTQAWHTTDDLLASYVAGDLHALEAASVEQHLTHCGECRTAIRAHSDVPALDRGWLGVRDRVEQRPQPVVIRLARRLGLSEPTSVLLAATASLRNAWVSSAFIALAFAFCAARVSDGTTLYPFLLVAPLIPVLGVASSYGPAEDSLESLVVTSPFGRTRLVLVRTVAVLLTCLPFAAVVGTFLPGPPWVALAWLGPALALVPILLALASFMGPRPASWVVAIGWSAVVLGSARPFGPTWPVEAQQQGVLLALAVVAVVVLATRSRTTRGIGATL